MYLNFFKIYNKLLKYFQAVLCPMAINTLLQLGHYSVEEMEYAEQFMQLIIQAILITTPVGFLLTEHLGPVLLARKEVEDCDNGKALQNINLYVYFRVFRRKSPRSKNLSILLT